MTLEADEGARIYQTCMPFATDYALVLLGLLYILILVILYKTELGLLLQAKLGRPLIGFIIIVLTSVFLLITLLLSPPGLLCHNGNITYVE